MKRQITAYVNEETRRKIAALSRVWGLNEQRYNSDVIERAIEIAFDKELKNSNQSESETNKED